MIMKGISCVTSRSKSRRIVSFITFKIFQISINFCMHNRLSLNSAYHTMNKQQEIVPCRAINGGAAYILKWQGKQVNC